MSEQARRDTATPVAAFDIDQYGNGNLQFYAMDSVASANIARKEDAAKASSSKAMPAPRWIAPIRRAETAVPAGRVPLAAGSSMRASAPRHESSGQLPGALEERAVGPGRRSLSPLPVPSQQRRF